MTKVIGIVKALETGLTASNGNPFVRFVVNGQKYSYFGEAAFKEDDEVAFNYETKGQYRNIIGKVELHAPVDAEPLPKTDNEVIFKMMSNIDERLANVESEIQEIFGKLVSQEKTAE